MSRKKSTVKDTRSKPAVVDPPSRTDVEREGDDVDVESMAKSSERKGKRKAKTSPTASGSSEDKQEAVLADSEGRSKKKTRKNQSTASLLAVLQNAARQRMGPPSKKKQPHLISDSEGTEASLPSMSRQINLVSQDHSDDEHENSAPTKPKKPVLPKREYTEVECRYQLTQLNHPSKRPPTVMTEDIFSAASKLGRDGVNPHRLRMEKDMSLADVEALFGQEKGRNGFLLAERLPPSLRKEVESLYCQCYQKPHPSIHIGKELAMGWTLQSKGHQVN
jgi:hypothetical protein